MSCVYCYVTVVTAINCWFPYTMCAHLACIQYIFYKELMGLICYYQFIEAQWRIYVSVNYITKETFGVACSWQRKRVTSSVYLITTIYTCSAVARVGPQSIRSTSQELHAIGNVGPITLSDAPGLDRLAGCCTLLFDHVNCLYLWCHPGVWITKTLQCPDTC